MDSEHPFSEITRIPTQEDLIRVCNRLNELGARYIVVGGAAVIAQGLLRTTNDLDLLVEKSAENLGRVREALKVLPDQAASEMDLNDLEKYVVVRVNDEITVDVMGSACGLTFGGVSHLVDWQELGGVRIPFASPALLWLTKQTYREKDALDRAFLRKWFADRGLEPPTSAGG